MNGVRTIIVSNRLPVSARVEGGEIVLASSSGGLATAVTPIAQRTKAKWIGWPGCCTAMDSLGEPLREAAGLLRIRDLVPVWLNEEETDLYYRCYCNEMIWPLFHNLPGGCAFKPEAWDAYLEVNQKFAAVVEREASRGDQVWVHDYHLMHVGAFLRDGDLPVKLAYFHHIPFPEPETFARLPWRSELLRALMSFHEVGFQTVRDAENFTACVTRFLHSACARPLQSRAGLVAAEGRTTVVRSSPVSIDFEEFANAAASSNIGTAATQLRTSIGTTILLGVDRLDCTKGLCERLQAFAELLRAEPGLREKVTLLQIVVPSREDVPAYQSLRDTFEREVSRINGSFGTETWVPVRYLHKHLSRPELLALYRAADVMVVTPVRDGMNLVAKEFCAARVDGRGVLVLSEFAGAALELGGGALQVNPYDVRQTAAGLGRALAMEEREQQLRMSRMREQVRTNDVFQWARSLGVMPHTKPVVLPVRDYGEEAGVALGA